MQKYMSTPKEWFLEAQRHHQFGRFTEAERFYRQTVGVDAHNVDAWYHLGVACLAQDKFDSAVEAFERTLAIASTHVDALTNLGIVLARQNRLPEALAKFRQAVHIRPDHAKAINNLGVVLTQMGQLEEGFKCYHEAARLQPDYAEAHFNLGVAFGDRKRNEEAIASYERALKARPDYAEVLFNLGLLLMNERRSADAVIVLEQAVRLRPDNAEAQNNLCLALAELGRFEAAIASCDAALRLRPLDVKSHSNRGNALSSLGRLDEAVASYDFALRMQPDYASARWNRSIAWLTQGKFETGWSEYEWRWQRGETRLRQFPEPRWDGSPLDGKTILLWCEQGLGDTIQFIRYARLLKERGATVWLDCLAKLIPLLATCPDIDRLLPEGTPLPAGFDCQAPLMSLPLLCGTDLSNVPDHTPYLFAESARVEQWASEFTKSAEFKIGVAWQGNPKHPFDQHRSFAATWFDAIATLPGVRLFSLQKGLGAEQIKKLRFPIVDLGNRLDENCGAFLDTAAAMQGLDLIITCDSALAHLAGALGKRVWLALSTPTDWRWMQHIQDSPWYPTMRLFRQAKLGEWGPVFQAMRSVLNLELQQRTLTGINVVVAPGELLDKLTILQIKSERITDPTKLKNVRAELAAVERTRNQFVREIPGVSDLMSQLKEINERLWDIENEIRDCERAQEFGERFISLARSVYQTNDKRSAIKRRLNELLGANFLEEKDYHAY